MLAICLINNDQVLPGVKGLSDLALAVMAACVAFSCEAQYYVTTLHIIFDGRDFAALNEGKHDVVEAAVLIVSMAFKDDFVLDRIRDA